MNTELKAVLKRINETAANRKTVTLDEDRIDEIMMEQDEYEANAFIYA